MPDQSDEQVTQHRSWMWTWLKRFVKAIGVAILLYLLIVLIGLIPVNNGFQPDPDGVLIHVTSNAVHADVIVPVSNSIVDWRQEFSTDSFSETTSTATDVAFGWGDKGFFIETPTWNDLKVSTAANALLIPSDSCMHVVFTRADSYSQEKRSILISESQYQHLTEHIKASFATDKTGQRMLIPGSAYGDHDAFFESQGRYHALNTCNSWVGRALGAAGVRVPWLTPLPKSPMLYLPGERGDDLDE